MSLRPALLAALLSACGSDIKVTQTAVCDGNQQPSEDSVDAPFDEDGDGYFDGNNPACQATYDASILDCDDHNADAYPGNVETTCNGFDDDCDAATADDGDVDGDRFTACEECDDYDAAVNPSQSEVECDDIDNDCDDTTLDGPDDDGDGYTACSDCDDTLLDVNPGATEVECNGIDDDCNEATEDGLDYDADTWTECGGDCDDRDDTINPGADEVCDDGKDNDCDLETDEDCDSDYTDTWDLDTRIRYSCALGLVSINFDQVLILDDYPDISVASTGSGSQPGTMTGTFSTSTTWDVKRVITGGCDEHYEMAGTFTSDTTFTATFTATYVGGSACFDCEDQSVTVNGSR